MEDKREILARLLHTLRACRVGTNIVDLKLEETEYNEQYCIIVFSFGKKRVDITGDSGWSIISDVIAAL